MFATRIAATLAALLMLLAPGLGQAQAFPSHPVSLVVPFPPGGGTDTGARIMAEQLGKRWGQPVIVDNRGGAAGQIGADFVSKARPDGYTLLFGNIGTQSINPSLYRKLSYDPDKAFAPVALVAELPLALMVNPAVPAKTPAELIALAKAQPGQLSYSTSGAGSAPHLAGELFKDRANVSILHVPYRGGGPAIADLLAGQVQMSFLTVLEASGHIKAGRLRALAVTSDKRVAALPDVPTLAESGLPGFNAISWIGILAPAGTPPDVVERISADVRAVLSDEAVKAKFAALGGVPHAMSPQEFGKLIADDRARYGALIRSHGISVD